MGEPREIDRLIEEGLLLYGQGDLDQALMIWEQALSIDPDNPQANSYVDYVRMNYELLTTEGGSDDPTGGFGLMEDDEPYKVEVSPGELAQAGVVAQPDAGDEGWFFDAETSVRGGATDEPGPEPPAQTMLIEADEPPSEKPVSFDDATREYHGGAGKPPAELQAMSDPAISPLAALGLPLPPDRHDPAAPDFESAETTPGFGTQNQVTDIKRRDLGFVRPTTSDEAAPDARPHRKTSPPPELKMTLRTPAPKAEPPLVAPDLDLGPSGQSQVSSNAPTAELDPRESPPRIAMELAASGAPVQQSPVRYARAITPVVSPPPPPAPPPPPQAPAPAITSLGIGGRMMSGEISIPDFPIQPNAPTRELPLSAIPTREDPLVSAPTRELGMRPFVPTRSSLSGDEEATKEVRMKPSQQPVTYATGDGTRHDIVLPFDPIDARSAQILDDVDTGAPDNENRDDRTRRRITALLDRAVEWVRTGESDKAVAAVDLALSEDPNAALAQKLIHRNRDTIMTVFQGYLGDLDRTPVLARPLHELAAAPISPRAAFLLSRVDGALTLDEILDVSGMPRLEAYRYLCQLLLRGILR